MADIYREKLSKLMNDVEEAEAKVMKIENELKADSASEDLGKQLQSVREELALKRNELARVCDGCGTPHTK